MARNHFKLGTGIDIIPGYQATTGMSEFPYQGHLHTINSGTFVEYLTINYGNKVAVWVSHKANTPVPNYAIAGGHMAPNKKLFVAAVYYKHAIDHTYHWTGGYYDQEEEVATVIVNHFVSNFTSGIHLLALVKGNF